MVAPPDAAPSRDDLIERARALAPAIAERAERVETERRVAPESVSEYLEAGLGRLLVPERFGGLEQDVETNYDIAIELGGACGSTAWCLSLLGVGALMAAQFDERAQQEVWSAGPDAKIAAVFFPSGTADAVDGGYRLSGRWPFASGIDHSDWLIVGGLLPTPEGRIWHQFLLPRSDYRTEDTWFNLGLRGTGSHDAVIEDAFVPAHRIVATAEIREGCAPGSLLHEAWQYRTPLATVMNHGIMGPLVGVVQGAFARWRHGARDVHSELTQLAAANARVQVTAADLLIRHNLHLARTVGRDLTVIERARLMTNWGQAMRQLTEAIDILMRASGAGGFRDANPLQRSWRDIHSASGHVGLRFDMAGKRVGMLELGVEGDVGPWY